MHTYTCTHTHTWPCVHTKFHVKWVFVWCILTPCHQAMQKCVIAIPCIVDGSRISTFSYTTSYTCICQLVWLTFCFKVIDSLMQDAWVSSYKKQDGHDPLLLKPLDCNKGTTRSLSVFLQLQSWLCVGMFCKRTIFCVSYMWIHVLMSLIIVIMKVWTITVTSPQLVHINNCDLLLVH